MREFVNQHQVTVDNEESFRRQVEIGMDSAKAGELVPFKEVEALFAARRAASYAAEDSSE
ncbi:hypothetical protein [Lysobacter sp. N42]|nr:hypothetical protein [Lysobacter sp. N42]